MKKLIALLALLALMMTCAVAEDTELPAPESVVTPLPIDFSAGHAADPALFTEDGYEDESITVQMYREWVGDARYNVAYVSIADPSQLRTGLAAPLGKKKTNKISAIAASCNAVIAIGGDYYSDRTSGYVVRQGDEYRYKPAKTCDALMIDVRGDFHIAKAGQNDIIAAWRESGEVVNVFNFGPALVIDGELQTDVKKFTNFNPTGREPRCAIGQLGEREYLLVVVDGGKDRPVTCTLEDGSQKKSTGCTSEALAQFMYDKGCVQAFALDGGNSALMVFAGENYSQKTVKAERSVSDIIYFATAIDFGLDAE